MTKESTFANSSYLLAALVFCVGVSAVARSQVLVPPEDLSVANNIFEHARAKKSLPCYIDISKLHNTDVLFRQVTMFSIEYPPNQIQVGKPLLAFVRVTSSKGEPVVLVEQFSVTQKESSDNRARTKDLWSRGFKVRTTLSCGFASGPGRYSVEVVLTDQENHFCGKLAHVKIGANPGPIPSPLGAGTVVPLGDENWDGKLVSNGHKVTVLLDTDDRSGGTLSPAERFYLLHSLAVLLGQIPCQSVRLVAFNLDQQLEIFRQDQLDKAGFSKLRTTLEQLRFGAISYAALQKGSWQDFLVKLLQGEASSSNRSELIIFLGPATYGDKIPEKVKQELAAFPAGDVRMFYLRMLGSSQGAARQQVNGKAHVNSPRPTIGFGDIPDRIQDYVKLLHGKTFDIDSRDPLLDVIGFPGFRDPLSEAIAKLLHEIGSGPIQSSQIPRPDH